MSGGGGEVRADASDQAARVRGRSGQGLSLKSAIEKAKPEMLLADLPQSIAGSREDKARRVTSPLSQRHWRVGERIRWESSGRGGGRARGAGCRRSESHI